MPSRLVYAIQQVALLLHFFKNFKNKLITISIGGNYIHFNVQGSSYKKNHSYYLYVDCPSVAAHIMCFSQFCYSYFSTSSRNAVFNKCVFHQHDCGFISECIQSYNFKSFCIIVVQRLRQATKWKLRKITHTIASKIIRLLEIIRVKKLIPKAVL